MPCAPSSGLLSFKHGKTFCFLLAPMPEAAKSKIAGEAGAATNCQPVLVKNLALRLLYKYTKKVLEAKKWKTLQLLILPA
jgi:hypothetical protein